MNIDVVLQNQLLCWKSLIAGVTHPMIDITMNSVRKFVECAERTVFTIELEGIQNRLRFTVTYVLWQIFDWSGRKLTEFALESMFRFILSPQFFDFGRYNIGKFEISYVAIIVEASIADQATKIFCTRWHFVQIPCNFLCAPPEIGKLFSFWNADNLSFS